MRGLVCFALLLFPSTAIAGDSEVGGAVGIRRTGLAGGYAGKGTVRFAAALHLFASITPRLAIGTEPGVYFSGPAGINLWYLGLPLVVRAYIPMNGNASVRVSIGGAMNYLARAPRSLSEDDDIDTAERFRRLDFQILGGVGVQTRKGRTKFFAELRYKRGLVTIDKAEPPIFAANEELGLWLGALR